jgi:hypothetical protein
MRPVENAVAIVAAFLVAGALLPWGLRLACAIGAAGLMLLLVVLRWRAHTVRVQKRRIVNVYAQVERLRAERKARFERPVRPGRRR